MRPRPRNDFFSSARRLLMCGALGLWLGGCSDDGGASTGAEPSSTGETSTGTTGAEVTTTTAPTTGDDTTTTTGDPPPTSTTTTTDPTTTTIDTTTDTTTTTTTGEPDLCGNGQLDAGEVCDDGVNDGAYDGCLPDCSALGPFCGDGEVNGPESCDDGNDIDTDGCLSSCVAASCGDGFVQEGVEACDDGVNDGAYDGCAVDCAALGPFCGDGEVNGPEQCDDGDDDDGDECSNACLAEFDGVFTSCGATGHLGPSQAMCDQAYGNSDVVVTVNAGIQQWTAPATGTYRIEVWGAEGGNHNFGPGGRGAHVRGDFNLVAGEQLKILVGQKGKDGTSYDVGGGGGSFVARADNTALIVAGGGGAAGNCSQGFNQAEQHGKSVQGNGQGGVGTNDGGWCGCGGAGSPGAGFHTDPTGGGAKAFVNGGSGDSTERPGQCVDSGIGGFGGGGNGGNSGPGGGGYQGGDAGGLGVSGQVPAYGKGGRSFNSGVNPIAEDGVRVGHGEVHITLL